MSTSAIQLLQQDRARLERELVACKAENTALHGYAKMLAELYWVNQQIAKDPAPLETVDKLLGSVIEIIGASDGSFSYLDPAAGELVFLTVHGALRTQLTGYRLKSDVGVAGWAVQEGQPVIVNNPRQDWRFSLEIDQQFSFNTRSILCMPVKHKHRALGAIQILNKRHNNFNQTDTLLASVLANVAATALAKMEPAAIAPLLLSPPQPPLW